MQSNNRHVLMLAHVLAYQTYMDKNHLEIPHVHITAVAELMEKLTPRVIVPGENALDNEGDNPIPGAPVIKVPRVPRKRTRRT